MKVRRIADLIVAGWLLAVGADYAGLIELPGPLGDLGLLTLIIVIGLVFWHAFIQEKANG